MEDGQQTSNVETPSLNALRSKFKQVGNQGKPHRDSRKGRQNNPQMPYHQQDTKTCRDCGGNSKKLEIVRLVMPVEKQNHFSKMCRSKRNNSVPPAPQGIINFTETELQDQDSSSS